MNINSSDVDNNQSAAIYVNKKGINELFEAMMTALMIHKPDDHIKFIHECLDKVEDNQNPIRWDFFVKKFSSISKQKKILSPIIYSKPIIFILSSSGSIKLCSRLLDRYQHINYLLINDIANIDEDEPIDLIENEHRYECIQSAIKQCSLQTNGFLIAGELDEQKFLKQWQEKLGRIDLIFILSFNTQQITANKNFHIIQIDLNNDFEDILTTTFQYFDELFPQDAFLSQRSSMISIKKSKPFNLPIIFCIDNHRHLSKIVDDEFEIINDEENNNNSFISTLCQRLAEQFSFKHIHYENMNKTFWNFEELKNEIHISMNTYAGYIIDHFPTSFNDLKKFQSEIGLCSVLIYIGDHHIATKSDEINEIIENFQANNKAIYVDCRMEVDEIYEDIKDEILKHL